MWGVDEQLLSQDYYRRRLSMFVRESLGLVERTDFASGLLIHIANIEQNAYSRLDIFGKTGEDSYYYDWLTNPEKNPFGYEDYMLDNIGAILNCPRKFTVNYGVIYKLNASNKVTIGGVEYTFYKDVDVYNRFSKLVDDEPVYYQISDGRFEINSTKYGINSYDGTISLIPQTTVGHTYTNKKYVVLNNYEYRFYLMVQLKKAHYFGTKEELDELYNPEVLNFTYVPTGNAAEVGVFWQPSSSFEGQGINPSIDLLYTFLDGKLTIESMGIIYSRTIGSPYSDAIWDIARWDSDARWQFYEPVNVPSGIFDQSDWDVAIWG